MAAKEHDGGRSATAYCVRASLVILLMLALAGCTSFAKGMAQAVMERNDRDEDRRVCQITGPAFTGIESLMKAQRSGPEGATTGETGKVRVLIIHGIGNHGPGYAARLIENLTRTLNINRTSERAKSVNLRDPRFADKPLGRLSIRRYFNHDLTRELLFYELSWSEIVDAEKHVIAYDDSGVYASRRTTLNNTIKTFLNTRLSDPLIYLGPTAREKILTSVLQSMCWMNHADWEGLENEAERPCERLTETNSNNYEKNDLVVVTHSLGSRIIVDALQHAVELSRSAEVRAILSGANAAPAASSLTDDQISNLRRLLSATKDKTVYIYMLANQLPLLQLGRELPEIRGRLSEYCHAGGEKQDERYFRALSIVAFSDPNDILSYAIPADYRDDYFDSRLCPKTTNVILNVAHVTPVLGLEAANPLEAHVDYDNDERVITLIAKGLQPNAIDPLVQERCSWLETVE